ncbi:hypothetical protein IMF27_27070 [Pseudomonas sp. PCH199]|uniref:hypothetical protein n=1 Tax=unclassified Pseudomonas TaxID=196821 RepID=UPI000BD37529|nr:MULTISPECIES: hypothetical protein [unclassified Pseudomonas]MCW8278735.1 hypothetical protein [Pseudomonas sp. PCH199]PAM81063.1 hypothetical protein CES87_27680 [Pseudomonas sp. ERMR1:02]
MNNRHMAITCLLTGSLFLSVNISATDLGKGLINGTDSVYLNNQNNEYNQWNGIGQIYWGDDPQCTASLLDTRDKNNNAVGPGYLLTAAECAIGVRFAPHILQPQPVPETVRFNLFNDTPDGYKNYKIRKTTWTNYERINLAILELESPLATLLEDGITPIKMAPQVQKAPSDVLVFGTGNKHQEAGLRVKACLQEPTGHL